MRNLPKTFSFFLLTATFGSFTLSNAEEPNADELRQWTDVSGKFKVEAELLTADKHLVVLERKDGELVAVEREQLSKSDREYVRKNDAAGQSPSLPDVDSRWELSDGEVVAGRLMGFGEQELNIVRERGDLWVNQRRLTELPTAYQKILPNVVSAIDEKRIGSLRELEQHLADLGGGPYKYTVAGVQLDLNDWGVITIPLTLLTTKEAKEVAPGYQRWLASREDGVDEEDRYETERRERLALASRDRQRRRYQTAPQRPMSQQQMQMMELGLLAADAGVTDIWQVQVRPANRYGYGRTVVVTAPNSLLARQKVAQRFRGWTIGAIAKQNY